MTAVLIGLVGAVALSLAVVLAVALPQLRQGSRILTPEGERLTQEAREKVTRGGRRAASGTADLIASALGRVAVTLKGGARSAGTSRRGVQRGAHRDKPDPTIGRTTDPEVPTHEVSPGGGEAQEAQDLVIDLRTPAEGPSVEPSEEQSVEPSVERAPAPAADPAAAGPEPNGSEPPGKRFLRATPESDLGLSKGRHAR